MRPALKLQLLGEFRLLSDGKLISLAHSSRVQALVAYLALHGASVQARQHLAYLFWPDATEAQARNNLRQALFQMRRAWPEADLFLTTDAHEFGWRTDVEVEVDVAAFERAAADSDERGGDEAATRASLQQAADLYTGDLLPGFYDEWVEPERERLRRVNRSVLVRLVALLEAERAYLTAIKHAERLLGLDILDETAYANLMRLHALNNDRAAALRVYQEYEAILRSDLDVAPGPSMRESYERLLRSESQLNVAGPLLSTTWPLIGRRAEWAQLQAAWRRAAGGQSALALVAGEAGIGKSRLAEELLIWASHQGIATARTRAYAAEGRLAYGPVADWLRSPAVRPSLGRLPPQLAAEVARLLPELMVEFPDLTPPEALTEYWQRQRFFEALARVILGASQPLLLMFDDLQWCDPETLEWLHYLLRFDPHARLLVVGTVRAEDVGPSHPLKGLQLALRAAGQVTELSLTPLDQGETTKLAAYASGLDLEREAAETLFRETEGNPLFVVETVRGALGQGDQRLVDAAEGWPSPHGQALPPRVHGVIAARLRQLSPSAGELAGLAATIGRAFSLDVLAMAAGVHEADLARGLDELWQRRIIREQGASLYDFSHDKLREVAYAEVSPPLRRLLHRRVAQALQAAYAADSLTVSGQIASHYERAGLPASAIPQYHRAATVAQRLFAMEEAIALLHKGLGLLRVLPQNAQRDTSELELQTSLAAALVASQGYNSRSALEAYSRARQLCDRLGQPPSPPILRGLAIASIGRGKILEAHNFGDQLRALAEQNQDPVLGVEANYVQGVTWFWQGNFIASRTHLEEALARYRPEDAHTHLSLYSQDPKVVCEIRLAFDLWCLGYPEQALRLMQQALAFAEALAHPLTLGYTLIWCAILLNHCQDAANTQVHAEAMLALHQDRGVPYWRPFAKVLQGWARAVQGDRAGGWADFTEGFEALRAADQELLQLFVLALRSELLGHKGQPEAGLAILAEAQARSDQNKERWCEADLWRRQGELLLQAGDARGAEMALMQSLGVARQQQARSFELRSAVRLARLWQAQGRVDEARHVLEPVYNWFTEGLALPELAQARLLLAQL